MNKKAIIRNEKEKKNPHTPLEPIFFLLWYERMPESNVNTMYFEAVRSIVINQMWAQHTIPYV